MSMSELNLERVESLFAGHGASWYGGEKVTQTEHALQCAMLAEQAGEPPALIAAALLHDIGHLMQAESSTVDRRHQEVGAVALRGLLGDEVAEPIRLHVPAKRYLCAVDPDYHAGLSAASRESLVLQGGPFDAAGMQAYASLPRWREGLRLRRYDDLAKVQGASTPPLRHYLDIVAGLLK
jgi:phosphonate degradation associated HDIG domain protein